MSLISRVEITNYLTEGLEVNHFANWNPMLMGITLRMDCQSSLINITNGGGKTSIAELLLFLLSRDKNLFRRVREKAAPKGRGYSHARIEFREVDPHSFGQPSLLEPDPNNLPGATRVIGVMLSLEVTEAPIFYSYSGTLEDSPCYTKTNGVLQSVTDDAFIKRTKIISGSNWNVSRVHEWQEHVGLLLSMDVIRRNAIYQSKGSDDKNASFFSFKVRPGETYDGAFFKYVIAPDLLTNLLNTFADDGEIGIGDTLHNSLSQIVNSEREMSRKKANLDLRESAITIDLKPVVDAALKASAAEKKMHATLRVVKKDAALLHHFGTQDSTGVVLGLPRSVSSLMRSSDQDPRIHKAIKGMVIQRDDGIVLRDKTLADLAGIEVRHISETAERKRISDSALNSHVIDFGCDFDKSISKSNKSGHSRKGYTRQAVEQILPHFADTIGPALEGLDDVFKAAFDIAQSQIDTNPASLKIYGLEASFAANTKTLQKLRKQGEELTIVIEGLQGQINSRADNEAAWNRFTNIACYLPESLRSKPKQAKGWLSDEVELAKSKLQQMDTKKGLLTENWTRYDNALAASGLAGLEGIVQEYEDLLHQKEQIDANVSKLERLTQECQSGLPKLKSTAFDAEKLLNQCDSALKELTNLKNSYDVFVSYFGDVSPLEMEDPQTTLNNVNKKKYKTEHDLNEASAEFRVLDDYKAGAISFEKIFGDVSPLEMEDPQTTLNIVNKKKYKTEHDLNEASAEFKVLDAYKADAISFENIFGDVSPLEMEDPQTTLNNVNKKKYKTEHDLNEVSAEFKVLDAYKADAISFANIFGPDADALRLDPRKDQLTWKASESRVQQNLTKLEPEFTALKSFGIKFPAQTPADWLEATDQHREDLKDEERKVKSALEATIVEIDALDRLAVVDDAVFSKAWRLLGDGPQRLYVTLQAMGGTTDRRIGALSALTGLLSAPVFESLEDLSKAAELLERHDIGIPLLLKEPLLQAIGSQGDLSGELRIMHFFAGRYSRQARILLDPEYAENQRELLVERKAHLADQLNTLAQDLDLVDYRHPDYVMATTAAKAIESDCIVKYAASEAELQVVQAELLKLEPLTSPEALDCLAAKRNYLNKGGDSRYSILLVECEVLRTQLTEIDAELLKLEPLTSPEALGCLAAKRNYLKKGGDARHSFLFDECVVLRTQLTEIEDALRIAEKRASSESINAYIGAQKYAREGADQALEAAQKNRKGASSDLENANVILHSEEQNLLLLQAERKESIECQKKFISDGKPEKIREMGLVIDFSRQVDDVEFMKTFASVRRSVDEQMSKFTGFQASVNFDRAADYYDNLDKSNEELVAAVSVKKTELENISNQVIVLDNVNKEIAGAEIPNWSNLRKAIHDLAYEIGSQAVSAKVAYAEFSSLEEGSPAVEAHPLYEKLDSLTQRLKSVSIDETTVLASKINEILAEVQSINLKDNLYTFNEHKSAYDNALKDYTQKNKAFCAKSKSESGTNHAAFNVLELDEIERATPQHISALLVLFERLNVSLEKDREDAQKAIQAAQNANEEALTQLSTLIQVANDNLDALKKVMNRYPTGCFKIKVTLANSVQIKEILSELTSGIKIISASADKGGKTLRRTDDGQIKDFLRETLIDKVFLEPSVTFVHPGIRANEAKVTDKLSTGQKVALEFMWIVRQAEYEIERGMRELSTKQAERKRQETNRVIFVDGIFSTLSDRNIIREAFSGLGSLGGNFQIIGFLHSPTWTNDASFFPTYHVGKKLTNSAGSNLIAFSESGRSAGTLGFFTSITRPNAAAA